MKKVVLVITMFLTSLIQTQRFGLGANYDLYKGNIKLRKKELKTLSGKSIKKEVRKEQEKTLKILCKDREKLILNRKKKKQMQKLNLKD